MATASPQSFRLRLIGGALAPLVIAGAIQALYSVVSQRHAAIDGLEAKAHAVTSLLVDVAGPSIALDDPKAVDDGLGYVTDDPDFAFAVAIAPDGKPIAFRGTASERAARVASAHVTTAPTLAAIDGAVIASHPVVTEGKTIGEIVVGLRTENAEAAAATLTTIAALISLAGVAAAVLVVLALAGRIARRNREMAALLDNVEQAFLSMRRDGTLTAERSRSAVALVGPYRPEQKLWDALAPRDPKCATWLQLGWASVLDGFMPVEVSLDQLPKQLVDGQRVYRIEYKPNIQGETVGDTLVVITDTTAEFARARAEAIERDLMRMFERMTRDRAGFLDFIEEADRLCEDIELCAETEVTEVLLRDVHTLKGNAGVFGLTAIAELCHELEDDHATNGRVDPARAASVVGRWRELKAKLELVLGPRGVAVGPAVADEDLAELHEAIARGAPLGTIQQIIRGWKLERTKHRLDRFAEQMRGLAQRLGKGDLQVEVTDHGVRLDPARFRPFWSALTHVIRNAVDHGIEGPHERATHGKTTPPRVELATRRERGEIVVEVRDDGRGIDWDAVRTKAAAAGRPAASHDDLVAAILSDGISTRTEVTETSGRGVGLAAVRAVCADLEGTVEVESVAGQGSRFRFRFPVREFARTTGGIPRMMAT